MRRLLPPIRALASLVALSACSSASAPVPPPPAPPAQAAQAHAQTGPTSVFVPRGPEGACPAPYEALSRSCVHPVERLRRTEDELLREVGSYERGAASPMLAAVSPEQATWTKPKLPQASASDADAIKRERLAALDRMIASLQRQVAERRPTAQPTPTATAAPAPPTPSAVPTGGALPTPVAPASDLGDARLGTLIELMKQLQPDEAAHTIDEMEQRGFSLTMDEAKWQDLARQYRTASGGLDAK